MATLGNARKFYLVTGTGTETYTWLAGEQSNNFSVTSNKVEVSDKETSWQKFISGVKGATVNGTVYTDDSSSGAQKTMMDALVAGTTVKVFVGELGSSSAPSKGMAAECVIDSISETNNNGEVSSRDIALTVNGTPTFYNA